MTTPAFLAAFADYRAQAIQARADSTKHHDYRRGLFTDFLGKAFGIEQADINIEQYIQLAGRQVSVTGVARVRKGWVDAIFRDLVFEFKKNLAIETQDGWRELRDYLTSLPDGAESIGLLTDGVQFTAYVLDPTRPNGLRQTDSIDLALATEEAAYLWLDAYLLKQHGMPPTAADIVRRFGLVSPTFVIAGRALHEALQSFAASQAGAFAVKRQQWAFYLAKVYGSVDAGDDDLFVRHTYLCQFAKVLAYTARFGIAQATAHIDHIIDGQAFEVLGISNIGEQDFFAWVLAPEVRERTRALFSRIAASLVVYDLERIDEDLLKQLYQNLVDPMTRHDLGEFYTPDWLAELTLREIGYRPGRSLLDPSCGSGTFLFTAIRLLKEQGLHGSELVDFALENIMGVDVHPLAVTIAKLNYMLAIIPALREGVVRRSRSIPVTMANALLEPQKAHRLSVVAVPYGDPNADAFLIPVESTHAPNDLADVLQQMGRVAQQAAEANSEAGIAAFGRYAAAKLPPPTGGIAEGEVARLTWSENTRRLKRQIEAGKDTIWVYVLQNTSRPLYLRYRKFDVIAGNPPWLSYRYIQDKSYQREIKELTTGYGLLAGNDVKLFTQLELASVFFEHCWTVYRAPGGTVAFVMPRSTLTGAKQHHAFQQRGFTRILDCQDVAPLFNVETCVLIRDETASLNTQIPTTRYAGTLPAHECTLATALGTLTRMETTTNFMGQQDVASPHYYTRFINGATLYPRSLVFVTSAQPDLAPDALATSPIMMTDPDVQQDAKAPWKGISVQGYIAEDFLYATLLSKQIVPFGVRRYHLVALPMRVTRPNVVATASDAIIERRFSPLSLEAMRMPYNLPDISDPEGHMRTAREWFGETERLWANNKKSTTTATLAEWLNYQSKIIIQHAEPGYLVLYGATGSNLAATVVDTAQIPIINGTKPQHIIVDHTLYVYRAESVTEAHYLAALLNTPCVDGAIKQHQTRGLFGPRHIHRRPFEVCPIPEFAANNQEHRQLAELSRQAHATVAALDLVSGGVVAARKAARLAVQAERAVIDAIARRILGLTAVVAVPPSEEADEAIEEEADDQG